MNSRAVSLLVALLGLQPLPSLTADGTQELPPPSGDLLVLSYADVPVFLGPHAHSVEALAWSPDGGTLATGAGDGLVRLWDAASGRLRTVLPDDATRGVLGLAFSPDGASLAVVGTLLATDVVIWNPAQGAVTTRALPTGGGLAPDMVYKGRPFHFRSLTSVAYTRDGRTLFTTGDGVQPRDPGTGLAAGPPLGSGREPAAVSPDGAVLAVSGADHRVRLWSLERRTFERTTPGPLETVVALVFTADGLRVVGAAGAGGRAHLWVWDLGTGGSRTIDLGRGDARALVATGDDRVAVAVGAQLVVVETDAPAVRRPRVLSTRGEQILSVAVSPDGTRIAVGGADRQVDVLDLATGGLIYRLPGLTDIVSSIAVTADGTRFATATLDHRFSTRRPGAESFDERAALYFSGQNGDRLQPSRVQVWSAADRRLQWTVPVDPLVVTAVAFAPGSGALAVAGWSPGGGGRLELWDTESGNLVRRLETPGPEVLSIAFSRDGRRLAAGTSAGRLSLWNPMTGEITRYQTFAAAVAAVAFSPRGSELAVADTARTVRLIDVADGSVIRTLHGRSSIESLAYSPDGAHLAAGTRDPGLEIWTLAGGGESRTLRSPGDHFGTMPGYVAFSPDGGLVVAGGRGKDIAVFDVATGALQRELRGHYHASTAAVFLPDGRLLSGAEERTVRLWDPVAGRLLATWVSLPGDPNQGWVDTWIAYDSAGGYVAAEGAEARLLGRLTDGKWIPR